MKGIPSFKGLCILLLSLLFSACFLYGRETPGADSWQKVFERKQGTVTALWYDIEPFIYVDKDGTMRGVEYEIMESLKPYLKSKYGINLRIDWVNAGSFEDIYSRIKTTAAAGFFGWSYYSITEERKKEVRFTLPYMPDLNVLVTNSNEPIYATSQEFTAGINSMHAYTMANTTMEEDVQSLRTSFFQGLPVTNKKDDYEVMASISNDRKGFGYLPLSVYIVGLQKGIRVKRQNVIASRREGFAAVMPMNSDWKVIMDEYFSTDVFRAKAGAIVTKYLGSDVKDLVAGDGNNPALESIHDLDMVSLEKEIVTKRLMDTAVEVQRQRSFRNLIAVILLFVLLIGFLLYRRNVYRKKLNRQLEGHNQQISRQSEQIDRMNQLLKLKVLQTRMNPHFLFNSLNSIQYFILGNDTKASLQYISRFSAFLRKVISFGDELSINVRDEADLLKEYLWLEQSRFPGRFDYEIRVGDGAAHQKILPLVTHSLVEEAIYKSVLNLDEGLKGTIVIEFAAMDRKLRIDVSDNGCTRTLMQERDEGFVNGGKNMLLHRMELYNRQSERKIMFTRMPSATSGTESMNTATLEIPQPVFDFINL